MNSNGKQVRTASRTNVPLQEVPLSLSYSHSAFFGEDTAKAQNVFSNSLHFQQSIIISAPDNVTVLNTVIKDINACTKASLIVAP